ncbi:hypothetical protein K431DRAFT_103063 [Polychaeton citri CBS 116435]|uniref:Uncharacterized protein n=1 Tax=Polychaeton citri CBS 116435 TaxID=1314669 RepID=A0A9P4UNQ6_9PEZI|nr:hypothetical protein K431DRAFT_103063 [Polychaeton citri CBS 116435]
MMITYSSEADPPYCHDLSNHSPAAPRPACMHVAGYGRAPPCPSFHEGPERRLSSEPLSPDEKDAQKSKTRGRFKVRQIEEKRQRLDEDGRYDYLVLWEPERLRRDKLIEMDAKLYVEHEGIRFRLLDDLSLIELDSNPSDLVDVQWDSTWEPKEKLRRYNSLIREFEARMHEDGSQTLSLELMSKKLLHLLGPSHLTAGQATPSIYTWEHVTCSQGSYRQKISPLGTSLISRIQPRLKLGSRDKRYSVTISS